MKLQIKKGATDITLLVFVQNSSSTTGAGLTGLVYNSAGLTCYYARPGAAAAALTLVTQTVTGAHSDGGFVEVDATNMPGVYRLDLSDAIVAAGVNSVVVMLKGATNMAPLTLEIALTNLDFNSDTPFPAGAITAAAIATGAIDADALAADAVTEIQSGLATAAALAIVDDFVDTEISAIITHLTDIKGAGWTTETLAAIKALVDDLETRLSAARAGYLDNLSGGAAALEATAQAILADTGTDGVVVAAGSKTGYSLAADQSAVTIGTANALGVQAKADVEAECGDALNTAFTDATSLNAGSVKDRLRVQGWIIRNKVEITDANGNLTLYKDDSTTVAFTILAALTDDSTTTTRKRVA